MVFRKVFTLCYWAPRGSSLVWSYFCTLKHCKRSLCICLEVLICSPSFVFSFSPQGSSIVREGVYLMDFARYLLPSARMRSLFLISARRAHDVDAQRCRPFFHVPWSFYISVWSRDVTLESILCPDHFSRDLTSYSHLFVRGVTPGALLW